MDAGGGKAEKDARLPDQMTQTLHNTRHCLYYIPLHSVTKISMGELQRFRPSRRPGVTVPSFLVPEAAHNVFLT